MTALSRATAAVALLILAAHAPAADKRPMTVEDLFAFKRVAAPQVSPDGKHVVYQLTTVDLKENKSSTALWVAATDGKTPPKQLTDPKGKRDANPRWSPSGGAVLFESTRSGSSQLWAVTVNDGEVKQLTSISTGASGGVWSPDGASVAFVSTVYPEFSEKPFAESDKLNKEKDEAIEKSPVKAKTFTKLFYRHWDDYVGDKRQHLFVQKVGYAAHESPAAVMPKWEPHDATPGDRDANPTSSTFSSGDDYTFSPDGKHLVFTAVPDKEEAWSTNYDVCRVAVTNTSTKWESLTAGNKAADGGPKFSPDGKKLAWRAQKKPGYEADTWDIVVADCKPDGTLAGKAVGLIRDAKFPLPPGGLPRPVTGEGAPFDRSANEFTWVSDATIWFTADGDGSVRVYGAYPERPGTGDYTDLHANGVGSAVGMYGSLSASKTGVVAFTNASMSRPAEVFVTGKRKWDGKGKPGAGDLDIPNINLSRANDALLAELDLPRPEQALVEVEGDRVMQMWVLKPPGFDAKKKWPVAYLVHGGPQGAWEDAWSFRWNAQAWAAQGYVVVMPNPRGSTGFGYKFMDEITGDWGGKCYRDLVAGLDHVEKLPYVDKDRIASAGGSFGGYMMNWFAVSDIAPRFKCLVTHCSVWNFESMWGTTDELWFDEWEHGGLPWEKPGKYAEFSPHKKAGNLTKHKTPMLIIHNDLDFRCPIGQGHELFSALQRQGVPSRFVNFPDEGHWVLKPRNSEHWHKEVFAWLKKYAPPGPR